MLKPRDFSIHDWATTKLRNTLYMFAQCQFYSHFLTYIAEMG